MVGDVETDTVAFAPHRDTLKLNQSETIIYSFNIYYSKIIIKVYTFATKAQELKYIEVKQTVTNARQMAF
jgi:hypothetical protein